MLKTSAARRNFIEVLGKIAIVLAIFAASYALYAASSSAFAFCEAAPPNSWQRVVWFILGIVTAFGVTASAIMGSILGFIVFVDHGWLHVERVIYRWLVDPVSGAIQRWIDAPDNRPDRVE